MSTLTFGGLQEVTADTLRFALPAAVVVIVALRGMGSYLGNYYITLVAESVIKRLREDLFGRMLVLPGAFYNHNSSGHLISLITFNVEQVAGAATRAIKVLIREGLTVVALFSYLFWKNWKLSLVFLVAAPLIGLVVSYTTKLFRKYSRRIQNSMGGVTHVTNEAVKGFQVVKAYGGTEYESERFQQAGAYNLKQRLKLARVKEISTPVVQVITFAALAFVFWLGLSPELRGSMDVGDFMGYIAAASLIAKPLRQLTEVNSTIQKGIAAAQSIFSVMDEMPESDVGKQALSRARGQIEFRNVGFCYEADKAVLQGINLSIKPGETVALVGRSGSGKSTLASLLPRFNDDFSGDILLDGQPLQDYRLTDLRKQVALVDQQVVLFEDTVARNIAYGDLASASAAEISEAARVAHAIEFIDQLVDGMDTVIGEDGVLLSGGQRQRLALARAILKDAPILILDEATSALDTESERFIQEALDVVMKNRTTLVIAHRLSTIEKADLIVVMDQGRIVETGNHNQLLAKGGAYANLHRMQFSEV